jgi:hypothetical protein
MRERKSDEIRCSSSADLLAVKEECGEIEERKTDLTSRLKCQMVTQNFHSDSFRSESETEMTDGN